MTAELERISADFDRVLGADHPVAIFTRASLGLPLMITGRSDETLPLLVQAAKDSERVLGGDHPDTLACRDQLVAARLFTGREAQAVKRAGPDHLVTINERSALGRSYSQAWRHEAAISLLERSSAHLERLLGPDHLTTMNCQVNLAAVYGRAGRPSDAIAVLKRLCPRYERIRPG